MPCIKDKSTVEAIAREFTSNGRCKQRALKAVGYSNAYALEGGRGCDVVFSNVRVKAEIAKIDGEMAEKAGMTIKRMHQQYEEDRQFARSVRAAGAAVSASISIARLFGMDKDAKVNTDEPLPLSSEDIAVLRKMAKTITNKEIAYPKLQEGVG